MGPIIFRSQIRVMSRAALKVDRHAAEVMNMVKHLSGGCAALNEGKAE